MNQNFIQSMPNDTTFDGGSIVGGMHETTIVAEPPKDDKPPKENENSTEYAKIALAENSVAKKKKSTRKKYSPTVFKPCKDFVVPNDKVTKTLFDLNANKWQAVQEKLRNFVEGQIIERQKQQDGNFKKEKRKVRSLFQINVDQQFKDKPLNLFDRLVMTALISEYVAGNKKVTIAVLWRDITGKTGSQHKPTENTFYAVLKSLHKLNCVRLKINLNDACSTYDYNDGKPLNYDYKPLINISIKLEPFHNRRQKEKQIPIQDSEKEVFVITINEEPLLYTIAKAKKHLLTIPREVFYTKYRNSVNPAINTQIFTDDSGKKTRKRINPERTNDQFAVILAVFYAAVRVYESRNRKLKPVIKFDTLFEKCQIVSKDNDVTFDTLSTVRKAVFKVLDITKKNEILKNYIPIFEGDAYSKISLVYHAKRRTQKNRTHKK